MVAHIAEPITKEIEDLIGGLDKKYTTDVLKIIKGTRKNKVKFFQQNEGLCDDILKLWDEEKKVQIVELLNILFSKGMRPPVNENSLEVLQSNGVKFFDILKGYDENKKIAPQIKSFSLVKKPHELLGLEKKPSLKKVVAAYKQLMFLINEENPESSESTRIISDAFLEQFIETSKKSLSQNIVDVAQDAVVWDGCYNFALKERKRYIEETAKMVFGQEDLKILEEKIIGFNGNDNLYEKDIISYVEKGGDVNKMLGADEEPLVCCFSKKGANLEGFLEAIKTRSTFNLMKAGKILSYAVRVKSNFDINAKSSAGYNALDLAILENDQTNLVLLLRAGATPICPTNSFFELKRNYDILKLCPNLRSIKNANKSINQIFKTFKFNPEKQEAIDVTSYVEMMKLIPGGEKDTEENQKEFRQARLDISAAFILQFKEKSQQELLQIFETRSDFLNLPKEIFALEKLEGPQYKKTSGIVDNILEAVRGNSGIRKDEIAKISTQEAKKFFGLESDASSKSVFEAYEKKIGFGFESDLEEMRMALISSRAIPNSPEEENLLKEAKEFLVGKKIVVGSAVKLDSSQNTKSGGSTII